MKINIRYGNGEDWNAEDVELHDDELSAFLLCNGIGYDGTYYKINNRVFEFNNNERSLTVTAVKNLNVIL